MGACGWVVVSQGRARRALYADFLLPSLPYRVHLYNLVVFSFGSGFGSVCASNTQACCTASGNRCLLGGGASCTGPVEMTVPVAGKHGTC